MEKTIDFKVNEQSLQEFADKWFVKNIDSRNRGETIGRRNEQSINPYYIIGKDELYIKKEFIEVCENDPMITFTLSDETRRGVALIHTYQYSVEQYDNVSLILKLVAFKVDLLK